LRDEARAAVVTTITVSGRQLRAELETAAIGLLADVWAVGLRHGVQPGDAAVVIGRSAPAEQPGWVPSPLVMDHNAKIRALQRRPERPLPPVRVDQDGRPDP
jgi:hypothetical protein